MQKGHLWDGISTISSPLCAAATNYPCQVEAGATRLELYGCEVTQCGGGDDIVPKDLGAIDVQVGGAI